MKKYTREDVVRLVEEEDVEFIRLQFTDIFGNLKNVAITSSQLEKALDNKIMFDGSSIEGFVVLKSRICTFILITAPSAYSHGDHSRGRLQD